MKIIYAFLGILLTTQVAKASIEPCWRGSVTRNCTIGRAESRDGKIGVDRGSITLDDYSYSQDTASDLKCPVPMGVHTTRVVIKIDGWDKQSGNQIGGIGYANSFEKNIIFNEKSGTYILSGLNRDRFGGFDFDQVTQFQFLANGPFKADLSLSLDGHLIDLPVVCK